MQRLQLRGPRELELFKLIWISGGEGMADFPVKDVRKRIYYLRQRFRQTGLGIYIISVGNGKYALTRQSHERVAELLNIQPVNYQ